MDSNVVAAVVGGISVAGVFTLLSILVWQLLATWRTKIGATREVMREQAYQRLIDDIAALQNRTVAQMEANSAGLARVQSQTDEIARLLKEV